MRNIVLNGFSAMALAAVLGAGAGVATAQVPPPPADGPPPPYARGLADRNADLTRAAFVEARVARLTALDADRDGTVSVAPSAALSSTPVTPPVLIAPSAPVRVSAAVPATPCAVRKVGHAALWSSPRPPPGWANSSTRWTLTRTASSPPTSAGPP